MFYKNIEEKKSNIKKILSFGIIIILIVSSIIYIWISNNSINFNTRRKINDIEKDVSHLLNYTETISDFIVDNYKLPEEILNLELKEDISDFKNISLKNHIELKEDISDFKNISLKNHIELKEDISDFKNISLKNHIELKELNKNFIRKTAIEFLNKYYDLFNPRYRIYYTCVSDKILNIDYFKLYEELLNIDYKNFIVSFAYFSENEEDNYKLHPIYKKLNETIKIDYNFFEKYKYTYDNLTYYYNENNFYYSYYKPNFIEEIPLIKICENINTYEEIYNNNYRTYYLTKIYNKYNYIKKIFTSFKSVSPQKFM